MTKLSDEELAHVRKYGPPLEDPVIENYLDKTGLSNPDEETRETKVKHLQYGLDMDQEVIRRAQKCQRNWNYTRDINSSVRDHLLWIAQNAPSKQHEGFYDVYWSEDRDTIQEMSRYTWGCTHSRTPPSTWRNAQANANMYILFVAKEPSGQENCHVDGSLKENNRPERWENAYVSIGIAMGMILFTANQLGLQTGCNKSHGDFDGDDYFENKPGILEDVRSGKKRIAYGMGIGYGQDGRPRYETDETEIALGAGNGDTLTEYPDMGTHPTTGKQFRRVKVVDTTEMGGQEVTDYYDNVHTVPHDSNIKINTMRPRDIKIIEIE